MLSGENAATLMDGINMGLVDESAVFSMVNNMDYLEKGTALGGDSGVILPFKVDFGNADSVFNGVSQYEMFLSKYGPELVKDAEKNPALAKDLMSFTGQLYNQNNLFHHNKFSREDDDGLVTSHAYREYKNTLPHFYSLATGLGVIETQRFNPALGNAEDRKSGTYNLVTRLDVSTGNITTQPVDMNNIPGGYVGDEGMDALAFHHEMQQGGSQIFSNMDYFSYSSDESANIQSINDGAKLLAANAQDFENLEGSLSLNTITNTTAVINSIGSAYRDDTGYIVYDEGKIRRAFFSIVKQDPEYVGKPPNQQTNVSGTKYMQDVEGYNVSEFREQSGANTESLKMLYELRNVQVEYGKTGLVAAAQKTVIGAVAQGKQLAQLFSKKAEYDEIGLNNSAIYKDDGTSAASLQKVAKEVLGLSDIEKISRIEALKLTLAARMARAVDPSGRLSDQDFRIQLQRLGQTGILTSQKGVLQNIDVVIEEFEAREKEFNDLNSILGKSNITVEDRRFIRATKMAKKAIRKARAAQYRPTSTDEPLIGTQKDDGETKEINIIQIDDPVLDPSVSFAGPDGGTMEVYTFGGKYYIQQGNGFMEAPMGDLIIN